MLESGNAYKCFCTSDELEAERETQKAAGIAAPMYGGKCRNLSAEDAAEKEAAGLSHTIRMRVPENVTYKVEDLVRGTVSFESKDIGDWVLVKANGIPTYNFAVVIDDHLMKISHVFRGEEHLTNTPKQLMIFDVFDWQYPQYGHMTLIVNEDRKKLSKRDESIIQFISQYKDLGYLPEAMFNFFALLGWSPGGEEEIFTHEELIKMFDVSRLSKSPSMFDKQKLTWTNNQYVKKMSLEEVIDFALPHLQDAGLINKEMTESEVAWAHDLIALYQDQLSFGSEIVELSAQFFDHEIEYDEESQVVLAGEQVPEVMASFKEKLEALETFDAPSIKDAIKAVQKETGHKGKNLFMPIRVVTTGQMHGPELQAAIALIGKEKSVARVAKYAKQ
jgi:nondiscriminating glutamyl-tRNA synthetase